MALISAANLSLASLATIVTMILKMSIIPRVINSNVCMCVSFESSKRSREQDDDPSSADMSYHRVNLLTPEFLPYLFQSISHNF